MLYLLRHAEAAGNAEGRIMGQNDLPLTLRGREQAAALAAWLDSHGVRLAAVYSSDLARALDTAAAVAGACGGGPVRPRPELRELGRGLIEGRTYDEAAQLRRLPAVTASFEREDAVAERIRRVGAELRSAALERDVAAVGHGGSLGRLLRHYLGLPPPAPGDAAFSLGNTGLTVLDFTQGRAVVLCANALYHLAPDALRWLPAAR